MKVLQVKTPNYRSPKDWALLRRSGFSRGIALISGCLALFLAVPLITGHSQTTVNSSGNQVHDYSGIPPMNPAANPTPDANRFMLDSMKMQENRKLFKKLNEQRLKEMNAETERLLALANQLKSETNKVSDSAVFTSTLSMDAVRQAEQIEKLAHSVRDKMRAVVN
jgi:hypothetical protein